MAQIPIFLIGKNVTSVVATVQTVASNGTLADSSGADIATLANGTSIIGLVDSVDVQASRTTENISGMQQTHAHYVKIARRDSVSLTEILRTGSANCLLANIWTSATSRYVKIALTRGGNSWTGYFLLNSYSESIRRGKITGTLTCTMVDPGQLNLQYA
jgi:hypothetical protein